MTVVLEAADVDSKLQVIRRRKKPNKTGKRANSKSVYHDELSSAARWLYVEEKELLDDLDPHEIPTIVLRVPCVFSFTSAQQSSSGSQLKFRGFF